MRVRSHTGFTCIYCLPTLLLALHTPASLADDDTGWSSGSFIPPAPWSELQTDLPAYPEEGRLLEVEVATAYYPYRVFIDPESLSVGADRVVRYAAMITSAAGARNVSFEGLRCSTREYRRYAYGTNGSWQALGDTPWERIMKSGMGHYRHELYRDYLCGTSSDVLERDEILRRLRYSRGGVLDE